jgi:hypothetical protein
MLLLEDWLIRAQEEYGGLAETSTVEEAPSQSKALAARNLLFSGQQNEHVSLVHPVGGVLDVLVFQSPSSQP